MDYTNSTTTEPWLARPREQERLETAELLQYVPEVELFDGVRPIDAQGVRAVVPGDSPGLDHQVWVLETPRVVA